MARFFTACAAVVLLATAPLDMAAIDGWRPNNSLAYQIVVRSDGAASIVTPTSGLKPFTVPKAAVARFFAALAASRNDNWTSGPCAKSAPFDKTIRVRWHGWVSGDVTCPPNEFNAAVEAVALENSVAEIVVLAGPPAAIPCYELPNWRPPGCKG